MKTLRLITLAFLLSAAGSACGRAENARDVPPTSSNTETLARVDPLARRGIVADGSAAADTAGGAAPAQAAPAATEPGAPPAPPPPTSTAMLIRTGTASVEVDSIEQAIAKVQALARQLGGYVANSSLQGGREQVREASLELKIPSARWDQAVSALEPIGKVESVNVQAEDVGEEFVDVQARMANAKRLEDRLLQLLANRTGKLEEVVQVEHELANVREEIERYEGRLRYLTSRVAMSTLTVQLHEPRPVVGDYPGASVVGRAFVQAWRNFVGFLAGFIALLGFLVPVGVLLAAAAWAFRRLLRSGRTRTAAAPQPEKPHVEP
jgi:hypothetical protein